MKIFKKQISILEIVELFVIIASICFLFWRCKYGYCFNDEPLFITFAERLFNGQTLYADEWHVAENIGIIIYPFYRIFRLFSNTNEGIILTFRYIYCLLWTLTCLYVYKIFRKEYKLTIFVFIFLILFQPLDYSSLSYTSISLMSSIIICCLLYKIPNKDIDGKYVIKYGLIFGLLTTILVLCVPLMAVPFFIFIVMVLIIDKYSAKMYFNNLKKIFLISLLVCAISFVTYLLVLFFNANTTQILYGVDKMLNSHSHMNIVSLFNGTKSIYQKMPVLCLASVVTCLYSLIDRKHKLVKYILFSICLILYLYYVYKARNEILYANFNNQMLYIFIIGFTSFFILKNKPIKLFVIFWIFSIIYVIFQGCLSSDTGLMAISMNLVVGSVAGLLCLTLLAKELFYDFYYNHINHIYSNCVSLYCGYNNSIGISIVCKVK